MQMDADDLPLLDGWKVYYANCGYAFASWNGVTAPAHRLIMGLDKGDLRQVDHINHDKLDNRRANLRIVTVAQNKQNMGMKPFNTSGLKGVGWHTGKRKWQAQIGVNGKSIHLGWFTDKDLASGAYQAAAKKYHGEYACLK